MAFDWEKIETRSYVLTSSLRIESRARAPF
jgi:hypothetical protein